MRRTLIPLLMALAVIAVMASPARAVTTTLGPSSGVNGTAVYSVVTLGPDVVIGGDFSSVTSTDGRTFAAGGLAALNTSTGAWVWSASPGGTTYGLATDGTNIYAGGTYGVRSYSQSGVQQPFNAHFGVGVVHTVTFGNGHLFYGGDSGVAEATSSGSGVWRDTAQGVRSLAVSGTQLLVGARYCTTAGGSTSTLVSLNPDGTLNAGFNAHAFACSAGVGQPPLSIAINGGQAYIGGGGTLNRVFDISAITGGTIWQGAKGDGDVQSVAVQGGQVYIGGHFTCVNGTDNQPCLAPRNKIARYSTTGLLDPTWTPNLTAGFLGVWAMTGDASQLYVGGAFTRVNGAVRNRFAIFTSS